ncbi:hypothetical protein [Emergencia sp.]|uniref:hypothetical protein n=1 Tax=Emergencia sp. TaxID=1926557 RepID=UPI003AEFE48A
MKKSRIISVALTLALVLTTVFAGTEGVFADTTMSTKSLKAKAQVENGGTINAVNQNNLPASENIDNAYLQFNGSSPATVKIKVSKASMLAIPMVLTNSSYATLTDENGKVINGTTSTSYSSSVYISASQDIEDYRYVYFPVKAAGTYTLQLKTGYGDGEAVLFATYATTSGGTLTKGKTYYGSSPNNTTKYYKVTAPSTGYFTVEFKSAATTYPTFNIKLANSKKTNLFKGGNGYEYISSSKNYKTRVGVAKGTYYIAVKTTDPFYGLNVKFTKVSESSGSTKSKAKALYKGKTKKGIITASQSSTSGDWYKITVKKKQKVRIKLYALPGEGASYGGIKFTITGGKYTVGSVTQTLYYNKTESLISLNTNNTGYLYPGTYYIKVQKSNGGSGYYNIKWL